MHFHAYVSLHYNNVSCIASPLHSLYSYILNCIRTFLIVSFSLSLSLSLVYVSLLLWHLNVNLLHLETFFISGRLLHLILLPHTSSSMMRRPNWTSLRTFLDMAFIRNAKSSCRTSPTLTYPLSFTVGVRSHFVASRHLSTHADTRVLLQHAWI